MLLLASDENFNGDIVRGLLLRRPTLDLVRLQDTDWRASKTRPYWLGQRSITGFC
jgi:hypothetical protein